MIDKIYLIQNTDSGYYKVGFTKRKISDRIKDFSTANPAELRCIYEFKTEHSRKVETAIKNYYKNYKIKGEWFQFDDNVVNNFLNFCQQLENNFNCLKKYNTYIK